MPRLGQTIMARFLGSGKNTASTRLETSMKHPEKPVNSSSPKSQDMTRDANKKIKKTPAQNEPDAGG
jgi:hypothetical protein